MEKSVSQEKLEESLEDTPEVAQYRKLKTYFLIVTFIGFGIMSSVGGPAIPDMVERFCVTMEEYSWSMSIGSIGMLTGAIFFGFLSDRFASKFDLLLACVLTLVGTMLIIKPYTFNLGLFYTWAFMESFGYAGLDAASNGMIFNLWGDAGNSAMHGLHMGWGIGFFIAPFIVMPFLGSDKNEDEDDPFGNLTSSNFTNGTCNDDSQIDKPFVIAGVLAYCFAIVAFILFIKGPPKNMTYKFKPKESFREVISPKNCGEGDTGFAVVFLILFALFYFGNAGREWVCNAWLFTYAVESDLGFTKREAALFDASAKGAFVLGRLLIMPISHFAPIQPMLFVEIYGVMTFVTVMATAGTKDKVVLWIFTCLQNMFASPIWPGGLTWADKYIPVTAIVYTVLTLGSASAGFFFQWFTGYLFTYHEADDVLYVLAACSMFVCVLLIFMQIYASRHGNRYKRAEAIEMQNNAAPDEDPPPYSSEWAKKPDKTLDPQLDAQAAYVNTAFQGEITAF